MENQIEISIVSYNTRTDLEACLRSIFASSSISLTASPSSTTPHRRQHGHGAHRVSTGAPHRERRQRGYGRANNQALLGRPGRYYFILNSDLELCPASLAAMIAYMDSHPGVGAAGGALLNRDGTPQTTWAAGELSVASVLWEQTFLARVFPKSRLFGAYFATWWAHDDTRPVPQACGAFLCVRADAFNALGGFDPNIFMYCEDTDLCKRLRDTELEDCLRPRGARISRPRRELCRRPAAANDSGAQPKPLLLSAAPSGLPRGSLGQGDHGFRGLPASADGRRLHDARPRLRERFRRNAHHAPR